MLEVHPMIAALQDLFFQIMIALVHALPLTVPAIVS
jgi:hypothetical protein